MHAVGSDTGARTIVPGKTVGIAFPPSPVKRDYRKLGYHSEKHLILQPGVLDVGGGWVYIEAFPETSEAQPGEQDLEQGNLTPKQKVWFVVAMVCLTLPIIIFVFLFSSLFSPRQTAGIGIVNMVAEVSLGYLILTKWISKIK